MRVPPPPEGLDRSGRPQPSVAGSQWSKRHSSETRHRSSAALGSLQSHTVVPRAAGGCARPVGPSFTRRRLGYGIAPVGQGELRGPKVPRQGKSLAPRALRRCRAGLRAIPHRSPAVRARGSGGHSGNPGRYSPHVILRRLVLARPAPNAAVAPARRLQNVLEMPAPAGRPSGPGRVSGVRSPLRLVAPRVRMAGPVSGALTSPDRPATARPPK